MTFGLLDIIIFISLFQLAVFVFFLLRTKTKKISNRILAVFLFVQIPIIVNFECFRLYLIIIEFSPHLFYLGAPFILIPAPAFYLYVKSRAYSNFKFTKKHISHLLPFLMAVVYLSVVFYFHSGEEKRAILTNGLFDWRLFHLVFNLGTFIQFLIYNISSLIVLRDYRRKLELQYSSIQEINLKWLTYTLYGFLIAWSASVTATFSRYYLPAFLPTIVFIDYLCFFLFFNFIFYKALIQPEIFSGIEDEKTESKKTSLSKGVNEIYVQKLITYMVKEKPYLVSDITLNDLAERVSIPPRSLSEVIHTAFNQNFYDFINSYRIKESQMLLADETAKLKTVSEVLFEVGFNSKSSFNQAFRKYAGMTPSEFKKNTGILHQN